MEAKLNHNGTKAFGLADALRATSTSLGLQMRFFAAEHSDDYHQVRRQIENYFSKSRECHGHLED
jgi:hypothetical protein